MYHFPSFHLSTHFCSGLESKLTHSGRAGEATWEQLPGQVTVTDRSSRLPSQGLDVLAWLSYLEPAKLQNLDLQNVTHNPAEHQEAGLAFPVLGRKSRNPAGDGAPGCTKTELTSPTQGLIPR